jgi:hypothetical protein
MQTMQSQDDAQRNLPFKKSDYCSSTIVSDIMQSTGTRRYNAVKALEQGIACITCHRRN